MATPTARDASGTHTAVKIEPGYKGGPTVWVPDASRAVGVATSLASEAQREAYLAEVRADYEKIRAQHARKSGHPEIAKLFDENANVEANEHFAREAEALKLAKSDEANLADGMAGERYENTKMYVRYAQQADAVGDTKVAAMFRQIAADEGDHYAAYRTAAEKLRTSSK